MIKIRISLAIRERKMRLIYSSPCKMMLTLIKYSYNAKENPDKPFLGTRVKKVNEKGETGKYFSEVLIDQTMSDEWC
jgi:hypothetical protein